MDNIFENLNIEKIYSKTIGSNIVPVNPISREEFYIERCNALEELLKTRLKENEYISYGVSLINGKQTCCISIREPKIDLNKKGKELNEEDYQIISEIGISKDDLINGKYISGYSDIDDDVFIIRTNDSTWKCLCGREWHYNIKEKTIKLFKMN